MGRKMKPKGRKYDPNLPLKFAILSTRRAQGWIARRANIGEIRLSRIVTGRLVASDKEQARLAKVLGRPVGDLFPDALPPTGAGA